jgi:hypothetical protein
MPYVFLTEAESSRGPDSHHRDTRLVAGQPYPFIASET